MTALSLRAGAPPGARILAATGLVAFLLFNYGLVATARLHATIARALLRAPKTLCGKRRKCCTVTDRSTPVTRISEQI